MRPHVEQVAVDDLVAHLARLPAGDGVTERRLSVDEETGAATTLVSVERAWRRPPGHDAADVEWFVRRGEVRLGSRLLGPYDYWRAPAGVHQPELTAEAGTELLLLGGGAAGFTASRFARSGVLPRAAGTASWQPGELTVRTGCAAEVAAGGAEPRRVALFHDPPDDATPGSGLDTHLLVLPPGHCAPDHLHRAAAEEGFCLAGALTYNFGTLTPGDYYWRPPMVKAGDVRIGPAGVCVLLVRRIGSDRCWRTRAPRVEVTGRAINYDGDDPGLAPAIGGVPVRSRSTGAFPSEDAFDFSPPA